MIDPRKDPKWAKFTADEKLDHLFAWCGNMTEAIERLRSEVRHLQEHLGTPGEAAAKGGQDKA